MARAAEPAAPEDEFAAYLHAVHPEAPAVADPPQTDFSGEGYRLPGHDRRLTLELLFAHPRDPGVRFFEADHAYLLEDGTPTGFQIFHSMTSVGHACQLKGFDAPQVAAQMLKKAPWPRVDYAVAPREVPPEALTRPTAVLGVGRGLLCYSQSDDGLELATHSAVGPAEAQAAGLTGRPLGEAAAFLRQQGTGRTRPLGPLRFQTFERGESRPGLHSAGSPLAAFSVRAGLTHPEILAKWEAHGTDAANRGTEAHFQAELFHNSLRMHPSPELAACQRFVREHVLPTGARPYRTEWEMCAPLPPRSPALSPSPLSSRTGAAAP